MDQLCEGDGAQPALCRWFSIDGAATWRSQPGDVAEVPSVPAGATLFYPVMSDTDPWVRSRRPANRYRRSGSVRCRPTVRRSCYPVPGVHLSRRRRGRRRHDLRLRSRAGGPVLGRVREPRPRPHLDRGAHARRQQHRSPRVHAGRTNRLSGRPDPGRRHVDAALHRRRHNMVDSGPATRSREPTADQVLRARSSRCGDNPGPRWQPPRPWTVHCCWRPGRSSTDSPPTQRRSYRSNTRPGHRLGGRRWSRRHRTGRPGAAGTDLVHVHRDRPPTHRRLLNPSDTRMLPP